MTEPQNRPGQSGFDSFENQRRIAELEGSVESFNSTTGEVTIHVDQATGNDSYPGTFALPLATQGAAVAKVPYAIKHNVRILFGPGTYEWTPVGLKQFEAFLTFEADENRSGVYNDLVTGVASGGSTTPGMVVFPGNIVDYGGKWIEMLDGADQGERRIIRDNLLAVQNDPTSGLDQANLALVRDFTNISPGDTFRIFDNNVTFVAPNKAVPSAFPNFGWFKGGASAAGFATSEPSTGGVALVGVNLSGSATFANHLFGEAFYYLYGVANITPGDRYFVAGSSYVNMGINDNFAALNDLVPEIEADKYQGWGLTCGDFGDLFSQDVSGIVNGFVRCGGRLNPGAGQTSYFGGYSTLLEAFAQGSGTIGIFAGSAPQQPFFLDAGAFNTPALKINASTSNQRHNLFGVMLRKGAGTTQPLVQVARGLLTLVQIGFGVVGEHPDAATGGRTVLLDVGGFVEIILGAATLGSASFDDWEIPGHPAFRKTDLALVGDEEYFQGTRAKRTS